MERCKTDFVKKGFESVRDLFYSNLASQDCPVSCAQVCVYWGEEMVVDLCGSRCEFNLKDNNNAAYNADSVQVVFSSSKVFTAVAVALMVERGLLKYSDKVSDVWPEFGQHGKAHLTVADVMRHETGLTRISGDLDMQDFYPENLPKNIAGNVLAAQEVDSSHIDHDGSMRRHYHYFTRGYLANEICRRVDPARRTLGQILKDHFRPLDVDAYVGVNPVKEQEVWDRIMDLQIPSLWSVAGTMASHCWTVLKIIRMMVMGYPNLVLFKRMDEGTDTFWDYMPPGISSKSVIPSTVTDPETKKRFGVNPWTIDKYLNSEAFKRAEQPGCNGIASARGMAKLAAFLAHKGTFKGQRLMSEATWDAMHDKQVTAPELEVGGIRTRFSQGGINNFKTYEDDQPIEQIFKHGRDGFQGWLGVGGSVCQYNPELRIGFGYNQLDFIYYDLANTLAGGLQAEVTKCVKKLKAAST